MSTVTCFKQRGSLASTTSVGISAVSLGMTSTSYKPLSTHIEFGCTGTGVIQVQFKEGTKYNSTLHVIDRIVPNKLVVNFRWPRRLDGVSESEKSQNIIEIDYPCVKRDSEPVAVMPTIFYIASVWCRMPPPVYSDNCPTVCGIPRSISYPASEDES